MKKVFIIAEAGVNHNGDPKIAKKLIDAAAQAGVDAVKFQTFKTENLVTKEAPKAAYQIHAEGDSESQYSMLKKLELTQEMHQELLEYCKSKKIQFLSTPFDIDSIRYLDGLGMPIMKIPSGEITNYPYLREIAGLKKPVIMSTGMSEVEEIEAAIKILKEGGTEDITLLHCNTEYPTPLEDVNLKVLPILSKKFGVKVGYSDHTMGIEVPIAAVALGACVIEKHFTLDRNMEGPDHKASLEPEELKNMVQAIRKIERALGTEEKRPSPSEIKNRGIARKSIVAGRDIQKGEILTEENITTRRPGTGISPMRWKEVLGQRAIKDFKQDELIEL